MLRNFFDPIVSVIYPQKCLACGGAVELLRDGAACADCWNATQIFDGTETLCRKCGAFLSRTNGNGLTDCRLCGDAEFDMAFAAGIYERALAATVVNLKRSPYLSGRARDLLVRV